MTHYDTIMLFKYITTSIYLKSSGYVDKQKARVEFLFFENFIFSITLDCREEKFNYNNNTNKNRKHNLTMAHNTI